MKTRIARDVATSRRPRRPIPAAIGTAGWAQAEADRARVRTVLRAPPDWRAPATTRVAAPTTEHGVAGAPIAAPAADQVMRMPAPEVAATSAPPQISRNAAGASVVLQRKCASGAGASGLTGECEESREKKIVGLQTKLSISKPGDVYEQEADRVADAVMRMATPPAADDGPAIRSAGPRIQRKCAACGADGDEPCTCVQRKAESSAPAPPVGAISNHAPSALRTGGHPLSSRDRRFFEPRFGVPASTTKHGAPIAAPAYGAGEGLGEKVQRKELSSGQNILSQSPTHVKNAMNTGGQPLDVQTRNFFEPRLGYDLSNVRVHTDSRAGESARAVAAKAYTLGNHIVFGRGQYSPGSEAGKKLIAHELAHVIQAGSSSNIRRDTIYRQPDEERELGVIEYEILQLRQMPILPPPMMVRLALLEQRRIQLLAHGAGAPPAPTVKRDYTKPQTNVAGSGMTRLEVHGLTFGTGQDFAPDTWTVTDKKGKVTTYTSHERDKTKESASHMAVVFVPDALAKLDQVDKLDKPVQVLLHFHGWGFRGGDPYAGYRIGKDKGGTVRDVHQEHLEQQVGAFVKNNGPLVVGILAQGVGTSDFGDIPTFEYIRDVLLKSKVPALAKVANDENYSVVLSAHSGGGSNQVVPMMRRAEAETAERSRLASQKAGKDGRVVNKLQPVNLIVLFEALNGPGDVDAVVNWVKQQINRLEPVLKAAASRPDAKAQAELAATPKLRGYFGDRTSDYATRYKGLNDKICKEIADRVPAAWQADVGDLFRIIPVDDPAGLREVQHEEVISGIGPAPASGTLSDALSASRSPASDRAKALPCSAPATPTPTKQAPKNK
jgi:hypothetical protein